MKKVTLPILALIAVLSLSFIPVNSTQQSELTNIKPVEVSKPAELTQETLPVISDTPAVVETEPAPIEFTPTDRNNGYTTAAEYIAWLRANGHPNAEACPDDPYSVCVIVR